MSLAPGWYVILVGEAMDLSSLPIVFTEPDLKFVRDGDEWLVTSSSFSTASGVDEVLDLARELMERVNGAMKLVDAQYNQVKAAHVIEIRPNGTKNISVTVQAMHMSFRTGMAQVVVTDAQGIVVPQPASPAIKWVKLAETDQTATEILWLLSLPDQDWHSLYKLHELTQGQGGHQWAYQAGVVSKSNMERLTATANNFSASGRKARHARLGMSPLKLQPMTLDEATHVMRAVAKRWLEDRC